MVILDIVSSGGDQYTNLFWSFFKIKLPLPDKMKEFFEEEETWSANKKETINILELFCWIAQDLGGGLIDK